MNRVGKIINQFSIMTKLVLVFTLFFINPNLSKTDIKIERGVKVLEAKLAKILSKKAVTACEQNCMNKLNTATNICNHLAPINREACLNAAFNKYNACRAACN